MEKIQVLKPCFGEEELNALREPFRTGWIGLGPKTAKFEEEFAKYCDVEYAVGLNSATAALDLSMDSPFISSNMLGSSGLRILING